MGMPLVINTICIVIILMAIYCLAGRKESRGRHINMASMLVSLIYCFLVTVGELLCMDYVPQLLIIDRMVSDFVFGILFIFYYHYIIYVTGFRIDRKITIGFMSAYAFFLLLLLTDSSHHWFYRKLDVRTGENGYFKFQIQHGIGFYLFYAVLLLTSFFCFYLAWKYHQNTKDNIGQMRKKRAHILLKVSVLPLMIAILYLFEGKSIYSPVCIGIGLSALLLIHALNHFNYMEVIQNAKALVADNMDLGLLIFDTEEHFLEANQFMEKHFPEVWETPDFVKECEEFHDVMTGKRSKILWKGRNYNCQKSEVRTQSGVLIGYALAVYDITDLEEYSHQLEILKEEAEKANAQKTKFLTNVTHEIRTPMNTILGMSEIAIRKNTAKDLEGPLKTIYREGEGVLEMVNSLLDVSKLESGTVELSHEKYEMETLLYEVSNMVYMNMHNQDLDYRIEIEEGFPSAFFGDRMRVKEIFQNLLGNAIKYTESGTITLSLGGEREENRYKIRLSVQDTGVGMDETDAEQIFQRFKRTKNARTEKVFGAGLGLNITMSLVKMMGGNITVQSRLNEGTTFLAYFYQEIADSEALFIKNMTRERAVAYMESNGFLEKIQVCFPGAHILLVDDMESNLRVEQGLMQLYGIEPEMVNSGRKALELVKKRKYDIIFLDHMMPQMDGIETLQRMRELENGKDTPIVAITANAVAFTTDFYEKSGFDDSLTKPLHTTELLEVLKRFIPDKIQQKETEEQEEILPIKSLMPEIDCTIGIRNIGGNIEKYHEILQVYYREMSQMLEVLQDYANEDLEQFRISVHGIKGSSRNIGAEDLADEALQLEELAKEGKQEEILEKLEEFLNTLDEVMTRVDTYLKDASEQVERDGDFLPELELSSVYQILKALAEFDMDEAEECLKELYKNRYAEDVEEVLEELKRYIEDLDYKHATSLLEDYLKKIG